LSDDITPPDDIISPRCHVRFFFFFYSRCYCLDTLTLFLRKMMPTRAPDVCSMLFSMPFDALTPDEKMSRCLMLIFADADADACLPRVRYYY